MSIKLLNTRLDYIFDQFKSLGQNYGNWLSDIKLLW